MTRGQHRCIDDSEESKGSRLSTSRAPPTSTTTNARQPALKSITALVASIKSELGLPPATSIFDTISMSRSSLELTVTDAITLKDMAIQVAQKLGIPITEEPSPYRDIAMKAADDNGDREYPYFSKFTYRKVNFKDMRSGWVYVCVLQL